MLEEIAKHNVKLLAVSKGRDIKAIKKLYDLGLRNFGESYAQELDRKITEARNFKLLDIKWHFIGAIQTNKINIIAKSDVIHSISSVRHAELLNQKIHKNIDIYLQVNLNNLLNRQGFLIKELEESLLSIKSFSNLNILGLMAILPPMGSKEEWFLLMQDLKRSILEKRLLPHLELSMGMSDDYMLAIKHGAGIIRLGSKLFGALA
jgi:pyridoxal phosphate enzyme (YggS family)